MSFRPGGIESRVLVHSRKFVLLTSIPTDSYDSTLLRWKHSSAITPLETLATQASHGRCGNDGYQERIKLACGYIKKCAFHCKLGGCRRGSVGLFRGKSPGDKFLRFLSNRWKIEKEPMYLISPLWMSLQKIVEVVAKLTYTSISSRIYENHTSGFLEATDLKLTQLKQISPRNSALTHGSLKVTLSLVPDYWKQTFKSIKKTLCTWPYNLAAWRL